MKLKFNSIRDTLFPILDSVVIHYSQYFDDSTIDTSRLRAFAEKVVFRGKYCEIYSSGKSLWCEYYTPISNAKNKVRITHTINRDYLLSKW